MGRKTSKLKDRSAHLVTAGRYNKAAESFAQLCEREPDNPRWPQKLAEAQRKLGNTNEAIAAYVSAAGLYATQGFLLKAIAICDMILALDPAHEDTQRQLAQLYAKRYPWRSQSVETKNVRPARASEDSTPTSARRKARLTIAPGQALDAVQLKDVLPEKCRDTSPPEAEGAVIELALDDEIDAAFADISDAELAPTTPEIPLFSSLDAIALQALIEKTTSRIFTEGQSIIKEGSDGDSLFVIVEGEVVVKTESPTVVELNRLHEGAFFGEIALLTHSKRMCTVEAASETTLLEINRENIAAILEDHPEVLRVLLRFFRDRLIDRLLDTSELFSPFEAEARKEIAAGFAFIEVSADTAILRQGQEADALYVLLAGDLMVSQQHEGASEEIDRLEVGAICGQAALLAASEATATVSAARKSWLLKLPAADFRRLIMTHPRVLAFLSEHYRLPDQSQVVTGARPKRDSYTSGNLRII